MMTIVNEVSAKNSLRHATWQSPSDSDNSALLQLWGLGVRMGWKYEKAVSSVQTLSVGTEVC